jgi:hypothetical protein
VREVDLAHAGDHFTGGFPIMKNVSLCWKVADGQGASWYVVGTHPGSIEDVVKALESERTSDAPLVGRYESCGVGNGVRISRQLQSWSGQADVLAELEDVPQFRATIEGLADLSAGIRQISWKLARPCANEMRLDVQLELAPPEATRP